MHVLKDALANFLREDIGKGDVTSATLPAIKVKAVVICKESAVVAGLKEVCMLFVLKQCKAKNLVREGSLVKPNTPILVITGNAKAILSAERTALNILMRMSGIATETKRFVNKVRKINRKVRIACTRKTSPGFRIFDKKAVKIGGGDTHRMRLDEMVLIKDNHLAITRSIGKAVKAAREMYDSKMQVEVEVRSLQEAIEAIEAGADIIMLDNLTPKQVKIIVSALKRRGLRKRVIIEVSGGVNHKNVRQYASIDIDVISIGSLTHSVKAIDMSFEIIEH